MTLASWLLSHPESFLFLSALLFTANGPFIFGKKFCAGLARTLEIQSSVPPKVGELVSGGSSGERGVLATWWWETRDAEEVESEGSEFSLGICFAAGGTCCSLWRETTVTGGGKWKGRRQRAPKESVSCLPTWVLTKEQFTDLWNPPLQNPCSRRWAHSKPQVVCTDSPNSAITFFFCLFLFPLLNVYTSPSWGRGSGADRAGKRNQKLVL